MATSIVIPSTSHDVGWFDAYAAAWVGVPEGQYNELIVEPLGTELTNYDQNLLNTWLIFHQVALGGGSPVPALALSELREWVEQTNGMVRALVEAFRGLT